MLKSNKNNFFTAVSILILIFGFQNCGNSSFQDFESIVDAPVSTIVVNDTKFRGGLDFSVVSLNSQSEELETDFTVKRSKETDYHIVNDLSDYICSFENPNASEELLQLTEITRVSHPSSSSSSFDLCDSSNGKDVFYKIGNQSPIFLALKDERDDCYSGNPLKLTNQNKRAFVVNNLFIDDINDLVSAVKEDIKDDTSCAAFSNFTDF